MEKIKLRLENVMKTTKYIYEKIVRQLMLSLNDKKVKESLKKNEQKLKLRFNTYLVLFNDIEHIVNNSTNTWKNI